MTDYIVFLYNLYMPMMYVGNIYSEPVLYSIVIPSLIMVTFFIFFMESFWTRNKMHSIT